MRPETTHPMQEATATMRPETTHPIGLRNPGLAWDDGPMSTPPLRVMLVDDH